jgi:hypothetical protein
MTREHRTHPLAVRPYMVSRVHATSTTLFGEKNQPAHVVMARHHGREG